METHKKVYTKKYLTLEKHIDYYSSNINNDSTSFGRFIPCGTWNVTEHRGKISLSKKYSKISFI
jgi:hypothetical protein